MNSKLITLWIGLFIPFMVVSQTANGEIQAYLEQLISDAPGSSGDNYTVPTIADINLWNQMITAILQEDFTLAKQHANNLNYQITTFTDQTESQVYYIVEEKVPQNRYWGTYTFSATPKRNNLVLQAPHSKYDTNTGKEAIYCFEQTGARALFFNGTHRCNSDGLSNCSGTSSVCVSGSGSEPYKLSDLAHVSLSAFQKTTENLSSNISNSVFIQLHGFGKQATDPYVIMSNGTRETPTTDYATLIKNALLSEDNSLTFKIAHIDTGWTRLIGFTNTQGRLINGESDPCSTPATSTNGRFIHIEQEKSKLRDNENGWAKMSNALNSVFAETLSIDEETSLKYSLFPNPTNGKLMVRTNGIEHLTLYSVLGKQLLDYKNNQNTNSVELNLSHYISGIYILKIDTVNGSLIKKIIRL